MPWPEPVTIATLPASCMLSLLITLINAINLCAWRHRPMAARTAL
jgi:hypothetical protein